MALNPFIKCMKKILLIAFLSFATSILSAQPGNGRYFRSFDGTKIYYEAHGTGYPVILVHGFIVNGQSWKRTELFKTLQSSGYQIIIPDLRGNGGSDKPHDASSYANDAEARDLMRLADTLGFKRYYAVGYSRGSIIVSRLMLHDPRVEKGVLGGMGDDFTDPEWPRRKLFYRALSGEPVKELEGMVKYVKDSGLDQQALALLQKEQPSTSAEELQQVQIPVLVICGFEDEDNGSSKELSKLIPYASYARVPGVHNSAHHSQQFADFVLRFLQAK
jgi:pimeloyl-ACP methyl ester carboxylesterase